MNKQKLWRAQHRFGLSDQQNNDANNGSSTYSAATGGGGDDDNDNDKRSSGDIMGMGSIYQQQRRQSQYYDKGENARGSSIANGGGDLKCFASAKNAGIDPLDDFVDGVFSTRNNDSRVDYDESSTSRGNNGTNGSKKTTTTKSTAPSRDDDGVPICTRHQRPCKLLTVKRNNKGNKGRKFYVCSLPRGEQCDFFKWEEDTVEVSFWSYFPSVIET